MEKKYELIKSSATCGYDNRPLYRIKATKDFGDVKIGDVGGFVESEKNLSHEGDCWIYSNARVYDNASIENGAKVYNRCIVCDNAIVKDNARLIGSVIVDRNAFVGGNATIKGDSTITDNAKIYDDAMIYHGSIHNYVHIYGNAKIYTYIDGCAHIGNGAHIRFCDDYMDISFKINDIDSPCASDSAHYTFYKTSKDGIMISKYEYPKQSNVRTKSLKEYEILLRNDLIEAEWENLSHPNLGWDSEASHIKQMLVLCELAKLHIK